MVKRGGRRERRSQLPEFCAEMANGTATATYVLESLAVDLGVEVDGVLPGDDVGEGGPGLALRGVLSAGHF